VRSAFQHLAIASLILALGACGDDGPAADGEGTADTGTDTADTGTDTTDTGDTTGDDLSCVDHFPDQFFTDQLDLFGQTPLQWETFPETMTKGETVTLKGTANDKAIRGKVYIGTPSGPVTVLELSSDIAAGADFSFDFTADEEGTYVIELIDTTGFPAANKPIYVDVKPCTPAPLDNPTVAFTEDLATDKDEYIKQVNALRAAANLPELTRTDALDDVAQQAAQKMADTQPQHYGCDIYGQQGCGENIGGESMVDKLVLALYWSPSHRRTMLATKYNTHGVGFVFDSDYGWLCSHVFASQ